MSFGAKKALFFILKQNRAPFWAPIILTWFDEL
jgi:hypothetical protein